MKKDIQPQPLINRELSWLEFNQRILNEAVRICNPPFERMKFLSIAADNLTEFFMIRVGSIREQVEAGCQKQDASGRTPMQQLDAIRCRTRRMTERSIQILRQEILPMLDRSGIHILKRDELTDEQSAWASKYYQEQIYPLLTPMTVDSTHTLSLSGGMLNLCLLLEDKNGTASFAAIQIPSSIKRLVRLPCESGVCFIPIDQLILRYTDSLLCGRSLISSALCRITRSADLIFDEEDIFDLPAEIQNALSQRRRSRAVRLEIDADADARLCGFLLKNTSLKRQDVYAVQDMLSPEFLLSEVYPLPGYEHLKYPSYSPRRILPVQTDLFEAIRKGDILLHHPYDSFEMVSDFLHQAADDPNVLAVKQTLYRVSEDSPIIAALTKAAQAGKQVTVLLEVKARFDEAHNIRCGRLLEAAGAQVIYGMAHLKTHAKIMLLVRREGDILRRYVHLGTGNYNDVTALSYTDHSFFTCREEFGRDASAFFNMLSGYGDVPTFLKLCAAPQHLRSRFLSLIQRETDFASSGCRAEITAKMNSLVDPEIISALYRASQAGVQIRLIVRGICCLRPGVKGLSENICVHSIVGRFLEHSRIYSFYNNGQNELFLSSADWMPRNFDRRVELLFPIEDAACKQQLSEVLRLEWADTACAHEMQPDGRYVPLLHDGQIPLSAQAEFMKQRIGTK